jgi:hypothetical protein
MAMGRPRTAVLSACSSLISIVGGSWFPVVQFSHFSVKEYLTSNRLAAASADVSRYHIVPEPAHLVLAHACLGVLLNLDIVRVMQQNPKSIGRREGSENFAEGHSSAQYAAEHWTSHAQVGNVSSCLKDAMETLFDGKAIFSGMDTDIHDDSRIKPFSTFPWFIRSQTNPCTTPLFVDSLTWFGTSLLNTQSK